MTDLREMTNVAPDPIGPLVPAAPVVAQLLSLERQSEAADVKVALAAAWLHLELKAVFQEMRDAHIDINQAVREGFPETAIRANLRDLAFENEEYSNALAEAHSVEREVERLMRREEFIRGMAWCLVPTDQTAKPVLIPVRPVWSLLCKWSDEIEAAVEVEPYIEFRRVGVALLDGLLTHISAEQVTLAQAVRETGLSPDDLVELIHSGYLVVDGETRSPRLRRAQFFTLHFQQLARRFREGDR